MSLKYLTTIAEGDLPLHTSFADDINHIEVLSAAKLIVADVPQSVGGVYKGEAVVHSITQTGWEVVASLRRLKK